MEDIRKIIEKYNLKSQGGLSQEAADETQKRHNIGNIMRDFNGRSHDGAKFFNHQEEYKKARNRARRIGKIK